MEAYCRAIDGVQEINGGIWHADDGIQFVPIEWQARGLHPHEEVPQ